MKVKVIPRVGGILKCQHTEIGSFFYGVVGSHCRPLSMVWAELAKSCLGGEGSERTVALPFKPKFSKAPAGNAQAPGGTKTPARRLLASGSLWKQEGFKADRR